MVFLSVTPRYARTSYTVKLDPIEQHYSQNRLITMADRGGRLTDEEWAAIEAGAHPGHFGGQVSVLSPDENIFHIDVYID